MSYETITFNPEKSMCGDGYNDYLYNMGELKSN